MGTPFNYFLMNDMASEEKNRNSTPASPGPAQPAALELEEADLAAALAAVTAERDRLIEEMTRLGEQLLRARAEFDNFRKRTEREKRETRRVASIDFIRDILPVLDGLELALKSASGNEGELRRGLELLLKQFRETLEKMGLLAVEAEGAKFDPHIHHAVEMVETEEYEDQTVIGEFQRGYFFRDQLLRPAMVRVASRPRKSETK